MVDTRNYPGSDEIKPFVISLLDFYKSLFDLSDVEYRNQVPVINSSKVRVELFKLNYD